MSDTDIDEGYEFVEASKGIEEGSRSPSPCIGCKLNPMDENGRLIESICQGMRCSKYQVWMEKEFGNDHNAEEYRQKRQQTTARESVYGNRRDSGGADKLHKQTRKKHIQNGRRDGGFHTSDFK